MENKIVVQKIKTPVENSYKSAERYYSVMSALNDLKLTPREVQLVAFTAVKGNISYGVNKEEFCESYGTTPPTINNMISRLKRIGVLVKDNGKIKVNPGIRLDFDKDINLLIRIAHDNNQ